MSKAEKKVNNVSSVSRRNGGGQRKQRPGKAQKWEIDLTGDFLLDMYHRSIISQKGDWCVNKDKLRAKFNEHTNAKQKQKLIALNGTPNIGNSLDRCGFLLNTARDSSLYKISYSALFEYRNNKLKDLDKSKMTKNETKAETMAEKIAKSKFKQFVEEIDPNAPRKVLKYQGTTMQRREESFVPTNMSCFICQEEFNTMEAFEDHVQIHSSETDFEYSKKLDKFSSQFFTIKYSLCKNSHNFCFEVETSLEDVVIEKIMVVQSRSYFYVNNMLVPYKWPKDGIDRFFVDSHLFVKHLEQPIVILCHMESSKETLFVEEHHFMRTDDFPKVHFAINPNRLPDKRLFESKFALADYYPSKEIQDALKDDCFHLNLMKTSNEFRAYIQNNRKLQPQTMGASLNILLQIEDLDTIREYLKLKQDGVRIRSFGDEYSFQLDPNHRGFVENIISLYDEIILTTRRDLLNNEEKAKHLLMQNTSDILHSSGSHNVGMIVAIINGRIVFKSEKILSTHCPYVVIFRPSRINFRYQYRSLELLPQNIGFLKKFLFPTKLDPVPEVDISLDLFNKNLNEEQLHAVRNIAAGPRADATYVVFGPPGTGKTTTLVEGILQLLKKPDTRILVAASSNSACDEVGLRLCKYLPQLDIPRCFVRIYSRASEHRTELIDEVLLENSNMYNGQFYPDVEVLHQYRVVVCTLSVVGKLATGKFGRRDDRSGVFTHLFIDEIAASMETEALIPITMILTQKSRLIIAGDHKQLGPVLKSMRAKELGLDASLMDRLLERDCYRVDVDTGNYDRSIQTRLIRNYRSHPAIVNLYSGLYYNHSLESCATLKDVSWNEVWHKSRNKEFPIIFHAIYENSAHDTESYSLFNMTESKVVMDYVVDLMHFGINGQPVQQTDIGIISPYKRQYKYIQEQLNLRRWFDIETGSVELFQGKEKNVIIVSFVRSGTSNLGFLENPRRLNVTLSRPKCILILIGNPNTLSLNKDFDYVIKECKRHNTFIGSGCQPRSNCYRYKPEPFRRPENQGCVPKQPVCIVNQNIYGTSPSNTINNIKNDELFKLLSEKLDQTLDKNENKSQEGKKNGGKSKKKKNKNKAKKGDENESKKDENDNDDDVDSTSTKSGYSISTTSSRTSSVSATAYRAVRGQNYNPDQSKNPNNKTNYDSFLNDLPQVPKTSAATPPIYTKEQQAFLMQQQQQQYYQYLQQNYNRYQTNNPYYGFANTPTFSYTGQTPTYNPYPNHPNQQQQYNYYNSNYQYQPNANYMQANNMNRPPLNNPYPYNYNPNVLTYQSPFNNNANVNLQKQQQQKQQQQQQLAAWAALQAYNRLQGNQQEIVQPNEAFNAFEATLINTSDASALKTETNINEGKTSDSPAHINDTKVNEENTLADILNSPHTKNSSSPEQEEEEVKDSNEHKAAQSQAHKNDSKSNQQKESANTSNTIVTQSTNSPAREIKTNQENDILNSVQTSASNSPAHKSDSKSNQQKEKANASNKTQTQAKNFPNHETKAKQQTFDIAQTESNKSPAHKNSTKPKKQEKPLTSASQEKPNNSPAHKVDTRVLQQKSPTKALNSTQERANNSAAQQKEKANAPKATPSKTSNSGAFKMETKTEIRESDAALKFLRTNFNTFDTPEIPLASTEIKSTCKNINPTLISSINRVEQPNSTARIFSKLSIDNSNTNLLGPKKEAENLASSARIFSTLAKNKQTCDQETKELSNKEKISKSLRMEPNKDKKSVTTNETTSSNNWRMRDENTQKSPSRKAEILKSPPNWRNRDDQVNNSSKTATEIAKPSSNQKSNRKETTNPLPTSIATAEIVKSCSNLKIKETEATMSLSNKAETIKRLPATQPTASNTETPSIWKIIDDKAKDCYSDKAVTLKQPTADWKITDGGAFSNEIKLTKISSLSEPTTSIKTDNLAFKHTFGYPNNATSSNYTTNKTNNITNNTAASIKENNRSTTQCIDQQGSMLSNAISSDTKVRYTTSPSLQTNTENKTDNLTKLSTDSKILSSSSGNSHTNISYNSSYNYNYSNSIKSPTSSINSQSNSVYSRSPYFSSSKSYFSNSFISNNSYSSNSGPTSSHNTNTNNSPRKVSMASPVFEERARSTTPKNLSSSKKEKNCIIA